MDYLDRRSRSRVEPIHCIANHQIVLHNRVERSWGEGSVSGKDFGSAVSPREIARVVRSLAPQVILGETSSDREDSQTAASENKLDYRLSEKENDALV
ncbi:hypothetical protein [Phormidium sp. CCY1219]|uniref:hypothetical protein n=1 Tax=Phormidium sp. CCY1219 TaxID=2886104 RepID=UPI002D1EDBBE|nr:hypothetical protein [Phormidium sp. CCY1219]MEB3826152.1 hypothetical protein [Phormidium sp. CCY1219]